MVAINPNICEKSTYEINTVKNYFDKKGEVLDKG